MSGDLPLPVDFQRLAKNSSAAGGYVMPFFLRASRKNQRLKASPRRERPSHHLSQRAWVATLVRQVAYQVGHPVAGGDLGSPPLPPSALWPPSIAAASSLSSLQ